MKILFGLGLLEDGCNEKFSNVLYCRCGRIVCGENAFFSRPHCRLTYSISFKSKTFICMSLFSHTQSLHLTLTRWNRERERDLFRFQFPICVRRRGKTLVEYEKTVSVVLMPSKWIIFSFFFFSRKNVCLVVPIPVATYKGGPRTHKILEVTPKPKILNHDHRFARSGKEERKNLIFVLLYSSLSLFVGNRIFLPLVSLPPCHAAITVKTRKKRAQKGELLSRRQNLNLTFFFFLFFGQNGREFVVRGRDVVFILWNLPPLCSTVFS